MSEQQKVEAQRARLTTVLQNIKSQLNIHRERLARKQELMSSCHREVKDAKQRLKFAEERLRTMQADIESAPGKISTLEAEFASVKSQLAAMDHSVLLAKAEDMAKQILALRAAGYIVVAPGEEGV